MTLTKHCYLLQPVICQIFMINQLCNVLEYNIERVYILETFPVNHNFHNTSHLDLTCKLSNVCM
jgi:hypothetical protein